MPAFALHQSSKWTLDKKPLKAALPTQLLPDDFMCNTPVAVLPGQEDLKDLWPIYKPILPNLPYYLLHNLAKRTTNAHGPYCNMLHAFCVHWQRTLSGCANSIKACQAMWRTNDLPDPLTPLKIAQKGLEPTR